MGEPERKITRPVYSYLDIYKAFCDLEDKPAPRDRYLDDHRFLIGRNIKRIRTEKLNLSFNRLAKASGISPSTLLRLENGGGAPKYSTLRKLVGAFTELGAQTEVRDLLKDDFDRLESYSNLALSPGERKMLLSAQKLNDKGQEVAAERVEELTKIPDYQLENV